MGKLKTSRSITDIIQSTPATTPTRQQGMLKNPQWEAFAHGKARGLTAHAAYIEAGFAANRGNASRLNARESVKRRIGELQEFVQKIQKRSMHAVVLSQGWIVENLVSVVLDAKAAGDFAGVNRALHLLGLELGMFVDKKEIGAPGQFDGLTIAEKKTRILALVQQMGTVSPLL